MASMDEQRIRAEIDTRTLDGLLDDLREVSQRLNAELGKLERAPRLSGAYHDALGEVYTLMTWLHGLSADVQTEIERLDDQLPDDEETTG
jgi:ABC-type transporter Mla subunit MlaD